MAADRVARSAGVTCSMAKAVKIGFPAFISEFRTAIAVITVHSTGEKPRTTRNGRLAAWTMTTEVIWPNRRASLRLGQDGRDVPRLVNGEDGVDRGEVEPELALDEDVEERDDLAGADRDEEARQEEPAERAPVAHDDARAGRAVGAGPAGTPPARRALTRRWPATARGRSSVRRATVPSAATRARP